MHSKTNRKQIVGSGEVEGKAQEGQAQTPEEGYGAGNGLRAASAVKVQPGLDVIGSPVVGSGGKPILDRDRNPIRVGDTLDVQFNDGPYGQVRRETFQVDRGTWPFNQYHNPVKAFGGAAHTSWDKALNALVCHNVFKDFEHGHETWAKVVASEDPSRFGQPMPRLKPPCPDTFPDDLYQWGKPEVTPANAPGLKEEERRLVEELCEADYLRGLSGEANRGLPCVSGNVPEGTKVAAQRLLVLSATFEKRWDCTYMQSLERHKAVYTRHPLVERFFDAKRRG
jgi:hypothetical protein